MAPARGQSTRDEPLLPEQELAANFYTLLTVILDDICGGVGFGPTLRQVAAGADHIDRSLGFRHDAAFGRAETAAGDDLDPVEPSGIQRVAQMEDGGGGNTGPDQVAELSFIPVATDRRGNMLFQNCIGTRRVQPFD